MSDPRYITIERQEIDFLRAEVERLRAALDTERTERIEQERRAENNAHQFEQAEARLEEEHKLRLSQESVSMGLTDKLIHAEARLALAMRAIADCPDCREAVEVYEEQDRRAAARPENCCTCIPGSPCDHCLAAAQPKEKAFVHEEGCASIDPQDRCICDRLRSAQPEEPKK